MKILIDNFEYVVVFFIIVFLFLSIYTLVSVAKVSKFFSNKKFTIYAWYDYEPLKNKQEFSLQIFNNNINDVRISGFGFNYKEQTIDYYKTYQKVNDLDPTKPLVILTRDSIKFSIPSLELETIIADYNRGKKRVSKVWAYITDSQGRITKVKIRKIRRVIVNSLKLKRAEKLKIEKAIKAELKQEKKIAHKKARDLRKMHRRDKCHKCWIILKTKLKIRPREKSDLKD